MAQRRTYPGIYDDLYGGMTDIGGLIKDAWVFGILPEGETCAGWPMDRFEALYDQVQEAWREYGFRVANLPDELRERHRRIHDEALRRAREAGWEPPMEDD